MRVLPSISSEKTHFDTGEKIVTPEEKKYSYHVVKKYKSKWEEIARVDVAGDCCLAKAIKYLKDFGYDPESDKTLRIWDETYWRRIKYLQHLKDLKMKLK